MSLRGSNVSSQHKQNVQTTYETTYTANTNTQNNNSQSREIQQNSHSHQTYSMPSNTQHNPFNGSNANTVNTYKHSRLTENEVSNLTGSRVSRDGSVVKGGSRVQYVPYQKKVVEYETRNYVERVPKTRKVVDYEERKVVQSVPREVIKQDFYAVQKRTQYYKEIIPEKRTEMVPVERKVKRVEYVPVENFRQIVHYPQELKGGDINLVRGKSIQTLRNQGVQVFPDAEYKPISGDLLYKYSSNQENKQKPIGYVDLGSRRYLSTAPTQPGFGNSRVSETQSPSSFFQKPWQKNQSQAYAHGNENWSSTSVPYENGQMVQHSQNMYAPIPFQASRVVEYPENLGQPGYQYQYQQPQQFQQHYQQQQHMPMTNNNPSYGSPYQAQHQPQHQYPHTYQYNNSNNESNNYASGSPVGQY